MTSSIHEVLSVGSSVKDSIQNNVISRENSLRSQSTMATTSFGPPSPWNEPHEV